MSLRAQSIALSLASFSIGTMTWRNTWERFTGSELTEYFGLLKGILFYFWTTVLFESQGERPSVRMRKLGYLSELALVLGVNAY
jgi:hypothetical protein